jgi:hypothetical protein
MKKGYINFILKQADARKSTYFIAAGTEGRNRPFSSTLPYRKKNNIGIKPKRQSRIILSTANMTQRYTIFFITVGALHIAGGSSKQTWHVPDAVCTVFELLMIGGGTARNM